MPAQRSQWPPRPQQPWMWCGWARTGRQRPKWCPQKEPNGCRRVSPARPVDAEPGGPCRLRCAECAPVPTVSTATGPPPPPPGPSACGAAALVCPPQLSRARVLVGRRGRGGRAASVRSVDGLSRSAVQGGALAAPRSSGRVVGLCLFVFFCCCFWFLFKMIRKMSSEGKLAL